MSAPMATTIRRARDFLLKEAELGFAESLDLQVGVAGHPFVIGAIFPVSVVMLALDAACGVDPGVRAAICKEAEAIADLAAADGWRYFNLCPEIPPDADDLAQVVALMDAADLPGRHALLAGPLSLLGANRVATGRYRTWLAPADAWAETDRAWGSGPDPVHPEVVANLAWALSRHDAGWQDEALATARWLAEAPLERTQSYWYYGHGYGAYQALRLWDALGGDWDAARGAIARALLARQDAQGAWELDRAAGGVAAQGGDWEAPRGPSELETAWCAAALCRIPEGREAAERACRWLASRQAEDGGFPAAPFFLTMGVSAYGSRAVTTAAVLLALAAR